MSLEQSSKSKFARHRRNICTATTSGAVFQIKVRETGRGVHRKRFREQTRKDFNIQIYGQRIHYRICFLRSEKKIRFKTKSPKIQNSKNRTPSQNPNLQHRKSSQICFLNIKTLPSNSTKPLEQLDLYIAIRLPKNIIN